MIDRRQKLIKLIDEGSPCPNNRDPFGEYCVSCPYYSYERCELYRLADYLLANGVTIQKWIPASEPPKEDGKYLVRKLIFDSISIIDVLRYVHDGEKVCKHDLAGKKNIWYSYDSDVGYYTVDSVTHWMPLPEEPKEECK